MKKIFITALLVVSITTFAQDRKEMRKHHHSDIENFTPEQRNMLMLKQMTLELDLNTKQQEQMKQVVAEKSAKWESMKKNHKAEQSKLTSDELFEMKMKMLDEQIAMKAKMKNILSPEQFKKWEVMKDKHHKRKSAHKGQKKCDHKDH
jgi:hypothetical protein